MAKTTPIGYRRFDGRLYRQLQYPYTLKKTAIAKAKAIRKKGQLARWAKLSAGYYVYVREP